MGNGRAGPNGDGTGDPSPSPAANQSLFTAGGAIGLAFEALDRDWRLEFEGRGRSNLVSDRTSTFASGAGPETYLFTTSAKNGWSTMVNLWKSKGRPMKGRAITAEEFERMVAAVPGVVGEEVAPHWRHYLRGLWASGLRLGESLDLWWDRPEKIFPVFPRDGRPMLQVPGELEKGNADRLLPIAPEFALFLLETPEAARTGPVFRLDGRQGRYRDWEVSKIVSKIGKAAGVKVYVSPKDPEKVKYASAHDFRRAFGVRWAARLMPAQLMELMRHESIETTSCERGFA